MEFGERCPKSFANPSGIFVEKRIDIRSGYVYITINGNGVAI
jgi:hypothetical protein